MASLDKLAPLIYAELHRIAHRYMRDERPNHPLQTTALVHEAYLRMVDVTRVDWQSRNHFFAVSAQMMRRILVEAARRRGADKRGGNASHVALDEAVVPARDRAADSWPWTTPWNDWPRSRREGPRRGTALLRGAERGGDRAGARPLGRDGDARLADGEAVAAAGAVGDRRARLGDTP